MTLGTRGRSMPQEETDLLAQIAEDYYLGGSSQAEIGRRHNISRSYVSRLLNRAREAGIVKISIQRPIRTQPDLEQELAARFGLAACVVVVGAAGAPGESLRLAGLAAAGHLVEAVKPTDTLAVSWGTGIKALSEGLRASRARADHVAQIFGGLRLATHDISGADLVGRIARQLDATFDYLHAPWIVESAALAEALMAQPDVAGVLARAAGAQMAFVGVGATGQGSSGLLFNPTYLRLEELAELRRSNAVGDIAGRCFDARGRPCPLSFDDRIIGLDLAAIREVPIVVGIAAGAHKGAALRAALEGGLINVLVTDRPAALTIMGS
ncbi:MAG: sugar-binding transcriptional regulator [Candidatus Dormibacteraceae bacterium]